MVSIDSKWSKTHRNAKKNCPFDSLRALRSERRSTTLPTPAVALLPRASCFALTFSVASLPRASRVALALLGRFAPSGFALRAHILSRFAPSAFALCASRSLRSLGLCASRSHSQSLRSIGLRASRSRFSVASLPRASRFALAPYPMSLPGSQGVSMPSFRSKLWPLEGYKHTDIARL